MRRESNWMCDCHCHCLCLCLCLYKPQKPPRFHHHSFPFASSNLNKMSKSMDTNNKGKMKVEEWAIEEVRDGRYGFVDALHALVKETMDKGNWIIEEKEKIQPPVTMAFNGKRLMGNYDAPNKRFKKN
ncbi:hypothetical protein M5689_003756 [Euphorbia peplus]|nr:hypothetical protein M5689_003756 [Euphorbia peplus]